MLKAFQDAKDCFVKKLQLQLPDLSRQFRVTTDASEDGIGGCLSQIGTDNIERPIAFFSKSLNELKGCARKTREVELFALLYATRKWRHYLYGRHFVWVTDHKPLLWEENKPSKKIENWLSELKEFHFTAEYIPGNSNIAADVLSRQLDSPIRAIAALSRAQRVLVPRSEVNQLLLSYHDQAGHTNWRKTLEKLQEQYFWEGMRHDVRRYCDSCGICCRSKRGKPTILSSELTSQPEEPWQHVAIDLVKIEAGYVLVILDLFSRMIETAILPNKEATTVGSKIQELLFFRYGTPFSILTDNGLEFSSMQSFSNQIGFDYKRITPQHPQSNGACEKVNQTVIEGLIRERQQSGTSSLLALGRVTFLYNGTKHQSTGFTPFEIVYGRKVNQPDIVLSQKAKSRVSERSAISRWADAQGRLFRELHSQVVSRDLAGKRGRQVQGDDSARFKVGNLVLLRIQNREKTEPRWKGPFQVLQVRGGGTYLVRDLYNFRIRKYVHHSNLLPDTSTDADLPSVGRTTSANPEITESAVTETGAADRTHTIQGKEVGEEVRVNPPITISTPTTQLEGDVLMYGGELETSEQEQIGKLVDSPDTSSDSRYPRKSIRRKISEVAMTDDDPQQRISSYGRVIKKPRPKIIYSTSRRRGGRVYE